MKRGVAAALVAALLLAEGFVGAASSDFYRERDFYALWSGSRLVAAGLDPYDENVWCHETEGVDVAAVTASGAPRCVSRYAYPLWTAVALVPLGVLPLPVAASSWLAISLAATLAAIALAWRAVGGPPRGTLLLVAIVIGSEPFWLTVAGGQASSILALGLALCAFYTSRRRERAAGAALALTALKPHVVAFAVLALAARALAARERAFLGGGVAAFVVLCAVSIPIRPAWVGEWLGELFGRQIGHVTEYATAWGVGAHDLGGLGSGAALVALVVLACVPAWTAVRRSRIALLAISVPLGVFATPYAWSYDFLVLLVPWAFILSRALRARPWTRRALTAALVSVASLLSWILYVLAFARGTETLSAAVPALTALLVTASLRAGEVT